jgi:hypothetical protein
MNSPGEPAERLLSAEGQWTEPWGDARDDAPCDKCEGEGEVLHECWSCLLVGARADCPACGGAVRWSAACPVCRGDGRIDGAPRHGVSVFPTVEGLYRYMLAKEADIDGCVVVELEAVRAQDVDFDADQGAILAIPTAIVACRPVDRELAVRVTEADEGVTPETTYPCSAGPGSAAAIRLAWAPPEHPTGGGR